MKSKILIVEDELIEAMNFESFINSSGFDVVGIATTGEETLEKVAELKPDLVLMDIVLKGDMDGIETAAQINEEFDIPVVYLTAHPEESVVNRAKITTPYGYLIKPINKTNLKNTIELALYKHNMEIKLKESEKKFRYILENSLDAAYRRNLKVDKYDYLSPVIEKILGYSVKEFISMESKKVIGLVHPKDRLNVNEIFENALSGRTNNYNIEYRIKHKNGDYKWINDFGSIVKDKNNLFLIGSVRDISEIKQSGEDLRESEEFLDSIVDNIPYMIFVKNANDLSFKRVNKVGEEYFGHPGSELIGKNDYEFFPKNEADFFTQKDRKVLESGELLDIPEETIETKKLGPRLLHTKKIPINDKKGNPQYLLGISEDITERKKIENQVKKAEKELQKSEKKYRELVDYSLVAMYETTLEGEILFANDAMVKMFDYESIEDLKAVNIIKLYKNAEDRDKFLLNLKKHENLTQYEVETITKSGRTFNTLINAHLIDNHITGMIIDISKVKRAEDALRESEEKYRTLFEYDPDYTILVSLDGVLLDVNRAAEQITGLSRDELIGKHFSQLGIFPKEEINFHRTNFSNLLKKGYVEPQKSRIIDHSGKIRWISNTLTLVTSQEKIDYVLIIGTDITERKKSDEQTRDHLKKLTILNQVINTANNASDINDLFKEILKSTQELLGYDGGCIYLLEENQEFAKLVYYENYPEEFIERYNRIKLDEIPTYSNIYSYKKPLYYDIKNQNITKTGFISVAIVPIHSKGEVIGSMNVSSSKKHYFSDLDKDIIESIGMETGTVITRMYTEEQIKNSLNEKETLLKEIHHRVKNNLQIISSLLDLQKGYVKEDPTAVNVLKESQNRVLSMSMIHEMLYQSEDLNHINIADYIRSLISNLFISYGKQNNIKTELNLQDINLNIETSIPLGLIVSELVSNSLKYAFPNKNGEITLTLTSKDKKFEMVIGDDGIGLPEEIDFNTESTLGLRLVKSLVNQLDGKILLDRKQGTKYTIIFNKLKYNKRI